MSISERIEAATEAFFALDFSRATPSHLKAIADSFGLTDAQFNDAAMTAISERMKIAEVRQAELDERVAALISKSAIIGKKQAEIDILRLPLPWSREVFNDMADLMVDHFLSQMTSDADDEAGSDLACKFTAAARQAFIERIVELSATSFPEVQA